MGHENKLMGHMQHFKEWNRIENIKVHYMYFGKHLFHFCVYL